MKRKPATRSARPQPRPGAFYLHGGPAPSAENDRLLTRLAWAVAALTAAALLAMVFGPHRVGDYMTETDFYGAYAEGARLVQQGRLDPSRFGVVGPVYEVVLGLAGFVIRDLFLAAELLSVAAATATLLIWFRLLRARADARAGLGAVAFLAANAFFFRYGYAATTDALAIALQSWALLLVLTRSSGRAMVAAGAVAGIAFLTRYSTLYLLPAGLVALAFGGGRAERGRSAAGLFAAGFLAPVLPWVLWSLTHGGGFSFQLHHNLAYEVFARARGIPWDEYQRTMQPAFRSLGDVFARDPVAVLSRLGFNVFDHLRLDAQKLLGWPVALAALVGLGFAVHTGIARRLWPLGVAGALAFLALVPAFHSERYSLAVLPFYATLSGLAFATPVFALGWMPRPGLRLWFKAVLAVIPLAFATRASVALQRDVIDQLPVEVLQAAETLRELKTPGDRLVARKGHLAWHAGVEPLPFPFAETLPALAASARQSGARWLWFSWPEAETRPQFGYLLDTAAVVPGLTVRRVTAPHPGVLYEIGPGFGTEPAWMADDTLRAIHLLRARTLVDGRDAEAQRLLALNLRFAGMREQAQRHAAIAARLEPRRADTQLLLGVTALDAGDFRTARAAFDRTLALDPNEPRASIGYGWASYQMQDAQGAAAAWRRVVDQTTDPATLRAMAEVFQALGDQAAAGLAQQRLAAGGGR